ncbi:hypothetical protein MRY82_10440 [bacterium]|nr:hypothetical protein [bacterium]
MPKDKIPTQDAYQVMEHNHKLKELDQLEDAFWDDIDQALADELSPTTFDEELLVPPHDTYHPTFANMEAPVSPAMLAMQETLLAALSVHLNPLARYMKALSKGEESAEVFEIIEMMISSLIPKLEEAQLTKHAEELIFFRSLMFLILGESDQHAIDQLKNVILEAYKDIQTTFQLDYRGYRKAIENIVEFYRAMKRTPSIHAEDIRKFFGIGVPSITWVRKTKSDELISLSGISAQSMMEMKKLAHVYHCLPTGAQSMRNNFGKRDKPASQTKPSTGTSHSFDEDLEVTKPDIYIDIADF